MGRLMVLAWFFVACAGEEPPTHDVGSALDVRLQDTATMAPDSSDDGERVQDADPPDTQDTVAEVKDPDVAPSDEGYVELTQGDSVLMQGTFVGYEPNAYGAEVYGSMLKIWASDVSSTLQILVRLNEVEMPGSVTPEPPGGDAWVLLFYGDNAFYATQYSPASSRIVISSCPDTEGMMLTGMLEEVPLIKLGPPFEKITVNATFEVLVGAVKSDVVCAD